MRDQRGFTYLAVLVAIALIGLGMSVASEIWASNARRQRLQQLEWVGQQYVQAIGTYYEGAPGGAKRFPGALSDLLEDKRYATIRRHIRQLYVDPMTSEADWLLIKSPDGGIAGISADVRSVEHAPEPTGQTRFVYIPLR